MIPSPLRSWHIYTVNRVLNRRTDACHPVEAFRLMGSGNWPLIAIICATLVAPLAQMLRHHVQVLRLNQNMISMLFEITLHIRILLI